MLKRNQSDTLTAQSANFELGLFLRVVDVKARFEETRVVIVQALY